MAQANSLACPHILDFDHQILARGFFRKPHDRIENSDQQGAIRDGHYAIPPTTIVEIVPSSRQDDFISWLNADSRFIDFDGIRYVNGRRMDIDALSRFQVAAEQQSNPVCLPGIQAHNK